MTTRERKPSSAADRPTSNRDAIRTRRGGRSVDALVFALVCGPLGLGFAVACSPTSLRDVGTPQPRPAVASELSRAPDAVVVGGWPAAPPPSARGDARGVVSLREPPPEGEVIALLQAFVDAWKDESLDRLLALATSDATLIDGGEHTHAALVENWRQRLRAHAYGRLEAAEIVRPERIERWNWDDLGARHAPTRPQGMRPGELLVRAPIDVTRIGDERVFGDVLVMILRTEEGRMRIAAYGEIEGAPR